MTRVFPGQRYGMWRSLVSAPALGAGGPRFESGHPDQVRGVGADHDLLVGAKVRAIGATGACAAARNQRCGSRAVAIAAARGPELSGFSGSSQHWLGFRCLQLPLVALP